MNCPAEVLCGAFADAVCEVNKTMMQPVRRTSALKAASMHERFAHMNKAIDRFFHLSELGTSVKTEIIAGVSTFAAMAYIICVQPALLSGKLTGVSTGMPFSPLITTTCLSSAIGCFLMGLLSNYPIGLAPGMGSNFFMVFSVLTGCAAATGMPLGDPVVWQTALAVILVSGVIFLAISFTPLRKSIMLVLSPSMKNGIVVGIGLFIAYMGLKNGGIVSIVGGNLSLTASFTDSTTLIFIAGLIITTALMKRKVKGAILCGIGICAVIAALCGKMTVTEVAGIPADPSPLLFKTDLSTLMRHFLELLPLVFVCFFMDMFDTMGTVLGVATNAGMIKNGTIERLDRIFIADAMATVTGAALGHSTVTSYIESSAGTEAGGRTGLTAIVVGVCFLLALIFSPLITSLASCSVVTAPALVVVGAMMMGSVRDIDWSDCTESIPSLMIICGIPFTNSIIGGISLGLTVYPLIKLCTGKVKETGWFIWITAVFLGIYLCLLHA